jgi:hypothetical protein
MTAAASIVPQQPAGHDLSMRQIWTPAGTVPVVLPHWRKSCSVSAGLPQYRWPVFLRSVEPIQATKTESGVIFVDIPQVAAAVNINGLEVFHDRRQGAVFDWR